jgi:hypothetical protein
MGLDAGKYFWRSGREKCFSLDIPFNRTFGQGVKTRNRDFTPIILPPFGSIYFVSWTERLSTDGRRSLIIGGRRR